MNKNSLRGILTGLVTAGAIMAGTLTAYAATLVPSINVRVSNNYDSSGGTIVEPTVTAYGSGAEMTGYSFAKEMDKWKPGSKVTLEVYLSAKDGYEFYGSYSSKKMSVIGGDFISAKKDSEDGTLTVKVSYYPVVQLGATEKAGWSDATKTKAVWKKVPYATAYQLRLYRLDDDYVTTLTMEGTSVDLSQYITKEANYYYEVKATAKDNTDAKYLKSGEYVTSEDNFLENLGELEGRWQNLRDGYKYIDADGVEAVNGWRFILGNWYYFNENGYAATGWCNVGGRWYYMNSEAKMMTAWLNLDNKWYYADSTGAIVTGWYQVGPTDWYYFYADGSMAASTMVDGYTLSDTGKMQ